MNNIREDNNLLPKQQMHELGKKSSSNKSQNSSQMNEYEASESCLIKSSQEMVQKQNASNMIFQQMKHLGINTEVKHLSKPEFTKNLSMVIQNFFTSITSKISKAQKIICQDQGLMIEESQDESRFSDNQNDNKDLQESKQLKSTGFKTQNKVSRLSKRRLIRKAIPSMINKKNGKSQDQSDEKRSLLRSMENNHNCKLKNNRLYMEGMPKKPVSSFFFFFKEQSKLIQSEPQEVQGSKQMTYGSVLAKKISQKWKQMSLDEKLPYKRMSQITRDKYQHQMDSFKASNVEVFENFKRIKRIKANETRKRKIDKQKGQIAEPNSEQQNSQSIEQIKKTKNKGKSYKIQQQQQLQIVIPVEEQDEKETKKRKNPTKLVTGNSRFKSQHKPKSPAPSFFFFYNFKKKQIQKDHNIIAGSQITKVASTIWKTMTQNDKKPFQLMAQNRRKQYYQEMERFKVQYPLEWNAMVNNRKRGKKIAIKPNQQNVIHANQQNSRSNVMEEQSDSNQEDEISSSIKSQSRQKIQSKNIKSPHAHQVKKQNLSGKVLNMKKNTIPSQQPNYKLHRPKAPISSFFMFYRQNSTNLADQFKQVHVSKLVQLASQIWKAMSVQQRKPYDQQSLQSRKKYYQQMEEYKEKYPEELKQRRVDLKRKHDGDGGRNMTNRQSKSQKSHKSQNDGQSQSKSDKSLKSRKSQKLGRIKKQEASNMEVVESIIKQEQ